MYCEQIKDAMPYFLRRLATDLAKYGDLYLVGGCIRDMLMGQTPKDFDLLLDPVDDSFAKDHQDCSTGNHFLVYRLWATEYHEVEVALPRKETKTGIGHKGFEVVKADSVLEDLLRRDFTVNAMAFHIRDEKLILPLNDLSMRDLRTRTLRPVTEAFREDPLRVIRAARFCATKGFTLHQEAVDMCTSMRHELLELPKERIRVEMEKALCSDNPSAFFVALRKCDCLAHWFPEVQAMIGVPHNHKEGDVFVHTMMALDRAARFTNDLGVMLAVLAHDFGKPLVPKEIWPRMHGHDDLAEQPIKNFCQRFGFESFQHSMLVCAKYHITAYHIDELRPGTAYKMLLAIRRTKLGLDGFKSVLRADKTGRIDETRDLFQEWQICAELLGAANDGLRTATFDPAWNYQQIQDAQIKSIGHHLNEAKKALKYLA